MPTEHKANSLSYNQKVVEKSDVSETLVKSLALLENDIPVRIKVLECLQRLSKQSCKYLKKLIIYLQLYVYKE